MTGLPIPGGVVGMAALLALLATRVIRISQIRFGAEWLLGEMLLFFVPAVPAVMEHREFLGMVGLKIAAVIVIGTVLVMAVTAVTVEFCCRRGMGRDHGRI